MYTTCKQQRTAKYTYNNTQRSRKRSPKKENKRKTLYILYTQTVQEKVLLSREDSFEPPKKHFNFGSGERSHIKLRVYFKLNNQLGYKFGCGSFLLHSFACVEVLFYIKQKKTQVLYLFIRQTDIVTVSPRSRRLEAVGTRKNGRARRRDARGDTPRVSHSRAAVLSYTHYFQVTVGRLRKICSEVRLRFVLVKLLNHSKGLVT